LSTRVKKRKDKERREDQKRKQVESQQKVQFEQEQQSERERMENDPFFNMYRPHITQDESEEQLQMALSESSSQAESSGPRTVWGTRQVSSREEDEQSNEWADHIVITKNNRKRRNKKH
jgi:hypothetical protein